MPTYEYHCEKCGRTFDHFQSMSSPALVTCPEEICPDKGAVRRLVGAGSGLIFKGSGFYITDYKKKSGGEGESSSSSSGESKTAAKSDAPASSTSSSTGSSASSGSGGSSSGGTSSGGSGGGTGGSSS